MCVCVYTHMYILCTHEYLLLSVCGVCVYAYIRIYTVYKNVVCLCMTHDVLQCIAFIDVMVISCYTVNYFHID